MSEVEFRVGRLREIAIKEKTFKDKVKYVSEEYNIPIKTLVCDIEDDDEYIEIEDFVYSSGKMLRVLNDEDIEGDQDVCEVEKTGENEYSYKLRYYNGGTCFNEMLEEGLNKLTK